MDQVEAPPLKTHHQHPEEVEHHENSASKMFRKVKAKAKKFKNSLTKHGQSHEHDHDVVEEDDEDDELEPEVNSAPGVTGKPETLSHPREGNVPAPEEIVPPGTKVFPVVSSDYTKPIEPVPLQNTSYGHDVPAQSVRPTDISDKEERREAPTHHPLSELSDREESRKAHEPMNNPVSLLSGTEDVTRTFAPSGEDDHLGGQRKINVETPVKLEDDPAVPGGGLDYLSGVSNYQSKATDLTKEGSREAGVPEIAESLGKMNVTDESSDQKQGQGFERDLSTRSKEFKEFDQDFDSVLGKNSPSKFAGESREAPAHHTLSELSDRDENSEAPTHHPLSKLPDIEESREAHEPMKTPVSLLSGADDVTKTFPPSVEDDYISGQRKVNVETPVKLEDDSAVPGGGLDYPSGVSNYQSKATDLTKEGSGEVGVPEIAESLGRVNVTDESSNQKQGQGLERDFSTRSKEFQEFDQDFDSVLGKDSPSKFAGERREAPTHHTLSELSDREERREAPTHHPLSKLPNIEESREAHEPKNMPVPLLSGTEDVTRTFGPSVEDDYISGQRKVNVETTVKLEDDPAVPGGGLDYLSGVSNYQSKVTDPTKEGSGEVGVPEIAESLGRVNVTDESSDQKQGQGFERVLSTKSKEFKEFDKDFDSVLGKDSPSKFAGDSEAELEKDFSRRSHDFDMKTESGMDNNSPSRSHEFDLNTESGTKNSPMGYGSESGAELGRDLPTGSDEFDQKIESGRNEYSPESEGGLGAPLGVKFPVRSHEIDVKKESGIEKDLPTGFDGKPDFLAKGRPGFGESEEKNFPARSDDVEVETELGKDLPTGTHDQFSPELARPKEGDEFEESRDDFEEMRDEKTQETKPKTYTEQFASMLGYSGESPVEDQTQVAGVDEKFTSVNEKDQETESAMTTKLPVSGGKSGVEETEQGEEKGVSGRDYLTEKLTPGEEDKALSEVISEKLQIGGEGEEKKKTTTKEMEVTVEKIPTEKISEEGEQGEAVEEEVKGGGVLGRIKGWFGGGATEEVKPKSPHSVEEASESLGSTVGTKGFPDSGGNELEETGVVGGRAVPVQRGV